MTITGKGLQESPYWGTEGRPAPEWPEGNPRYLSLGAVLLLVSFLAVNVAGGLAVGRQGLDVVVLHAVLEAGAAALAVVVGLLCAVRWRLSGEAGALWAGIALLTFGMVTVGLTGLLPLVYDPAIDITVWLRPASRVVTLALLATAVAVPTVDTRLRITRLVILAAATTALLTVVFQQLPSVAQHLAGAADVGPGAPVSPYGPVFVTVAWGLLAAAFLWRGYRERRSLLVWLGLLVAGLGLAELTRVMAAVDATLWSAGAHLLRLTALALGMVGATSELQRAFHNQSHRLLQTEVSAAAAEARARAGRHESEERAHEARNALAAIEGASQTLERFRDQLSAAERASLTAALSAEIARLQRLVSAENVDDAAGVFPVAEALAPVATGARTRGTAVHVHIDEALTAYGRWADVAGVVQNLLENARRYAPGSPVTIRADREGDHVLIRVEDSGPGVPAEQRETIFRRGVRSPRTAAATHGSGLGLFVAARLMHDQEGHLWVEDRPGGGAVFIAALPAAAGHGAADGPDPQAPSPAGDRPGGPLQGSRTPVDEGDEGFEVADRDGLCSDMRDAGGGGLR